MEIIKIIKSDEVTLKECDLLMQMGYTVDCNDGKISKIWRK